MKIKKATIADLPGIRTFVDFWLSGRGTQVNAPGAVNDCFISTSQHKRYIEKYSTYIAITGKAIIAWSVIQHDGSLIHLLVSGYHRNEGVGTKIIKFLAPKKIHSKLDQTSGNPAAFYKKLGYTKTETIKSQSRVDINKIRPNRPKNIDIFKLISKPL